MVRNGLLPELLKHALDFLIHTGVVTARLAQKLVAARLRE
jgi:hypothetical protein